MKHDMTAIQTATRRIAQAVVNNNVDRLRALLDAYAESVEFVFKIGGGLGNLHSLDEAIDCAGEATFAAKTVVDSFEFKSGDDDSFLSSSLYDPAKDVADVEHDKILRIGAGLQVIRLLTPMMTKENWQPTLEMFRSFTQQARALLAQD